MTGKNIAKEYAHRIWDQQDLNAIHDLLDPGIIIHSSLGDFKGPEAMQKVVYAWLIGFPDLAVTNKAVICEHDLVVIHWQAKGSHNGSFKGIHPTGNSVSYDGVTIYRIKDYKIIEYWAYIDMQHLLNQIR